MYYGKDNYSYLYFFLKLYIKFNSIQFILKTLCAIAIKRLK